MPCGCGAGIFHGSFDGVDQGEKQCYKPSFGHVLFQQFVGCSQSHFQIATLEETGPDQGPGFTHQYGWSDAVSRNVTDYQPQSPVFQGKEIVIISSRAVAGKTESRQLDVVDSRDFFREKALLDGPGDVQGVLDLFLLDVVLYETGVVQGDSRKVPQGQYPVFIPGVEGALPFVEDLHDSDEIPFVVQHRGTEYVPGAVPRFEVPGRVKAVIGVAIGDVDESACVGHRPCDALTQREANLLDFVGFEHPGVDGSGLWVVKVKARPFGSQKACGTVGNQGQELVLVFFDSQ